jgi:hypothetical protein
MCQMQAQEQNDDVPDHAAKPSLMDAPPQMTGINR